MVKKILQSVDESGLGETGGGESVGVESGVVESGVVESGGVESGVVESIAISEHVYKDNYCEIVSRGDRFTFIQKNKNDVTKVIAKCIEKHNNGRLMFYKCEYLGLQDV